MIMQKSQAAKRSSLGIITAVYLLGIFMGAIDTGIVTPARTIIQNGLNVDDKTGIWMITIYTLAYAASIPIMGKLADKFGRKYVYLISITLFGLGSFFCGLSQDFNSFTILLIARAVQAVGGGGIMPVATAEFGTEFPPEKRGMALGLVGGVYGIANIFGSSAGSAVLNIFGSTNWQFIFYVNVPITIFIIIAGLIILPNNKAASVKKIDKLGILLIVAMILSLLYGLRNIDFFNFNSTFTSTAVYPYLIIFVVLLPLFILAEKKAEDPVMNLNYFTDYKIGITLLIAFMTGVIMMGMIFVPQFSENAMRIPSGDGGYFVIILGIFAGIGAPFSGRLTDRFGPKIVLGFGFAVSIISSLFLVFVTTVYPSMLTVTVCLILIGLGMGFTIGSPLNYMMLDNTKKEESNSALAALSLVRSIGTTIAPAIMIGFIAHAGTNIQPALMDLMPKEVTVPQLPYAQQLTDKFKTLKADPNMKNKLAGVTIPDLTTMTTVKIDMKGSGGSVPQSLINLMETADVTNITKRTQTFADTMFKKNTPSVESDITSGVQNGINSIDGSIPDLDKNISDMTAAINGVNQGIGGMTKAAAGMKSGIDGMTAAISQQKSALVQMNVLYQQMLAYTPTAASGMPTAVSGMPAGISSSSFSIVDMIPASVKSQIPQSVLGQLKDVKTPNDLKAKINQLQQAIGTLTASRASLQSQYDAMNTKIAQTKQQLAGMQSALTGMNSAKTQLTDTVSEMTTLKNAVPDAFNQADKNYLNEIQKLSPEIETTFQNTLNVGFKQVYLTTAAACVIALLMLLVYPNRRRLQQFHKRTGEIKSDFYVSNIKIR
jgi:EmrB/QacA subfamily drug resistance transporter